MKPLFILGLSLALGGCLYGQCMNGPCSLERARILDSIKAYGEYWTKPGMTKESWQRDWVACGGMEDGNYVAGPRLARETDDFGASRRTARKLATCMQAKGYEYHYTGP